MATADGPDSAACPRRMSATSDPRTPSVATLSGPPAAPASSSFQRRWTARRRCGGDSLTEAEEFSRLQKRLAALEEQLQRLRLSRRILMDLLLAQERNKRAEIDRLRAENERLRRITLEHKLRVVAGDGARTLIPRECAAAARRPALPRRRGRSPSGWTTSPGQGCERCAEARRSTPHRLAQCGAVWTLCRTVRWPPSPGANVVAPMMRRSSRQCLSTDHPFRSPRQLAAASFRSVSRAQRRYPRQLLAADRAVRSAGAPPGIENQ